MTLYWRYAINKGIDLCPIRSKLGFDIIAEKTFGAMIDSNRTPEFIMEARAPEELFDCEYAWRATRGLIAEMVRAKNTITVEYLECILRDSGVYFDTRDGTYVYRNGNINKCL